MKLTLLFFGLTTLTLLAKGQKTETTIIRSYSGKIDQYSIEMTLRYHLKNDSVDGSYYYTKKGKDNNLFLTGTRRNKTLAFKELGISVVNKEAVHKTTGYFNLQISDKWTLNGTWLNAQKNKSLTAALNCLQNPENYDPTHYSYKPSIYKTKMQSFSNTPMEIYKITALQIYSVEGNLVQILNGFDEFISDQTIEIEYEDLNFDGTLDLKILKTFPGRIKNDYAFIYYLYNPISKKFVRSKALEELEVVNTDAQHKLLIKYLADGRGNETTQYYKWQGPIPYLIKEISQHEDDNQTQYTEYQIINKKSVKVKTYKN